MVEIQKPHSALKRPSLKRETVVVNNSAPTIKKVTLVPKDEELVAISPERRNWRGIFIALLVIAAVFSLIIFSIFLLSPEDEGLRIRGRRMLPSDILSKSLQWKPFNGTWSNDHELVYRDPSGGLSILNMTDYTTRILMTNSTFRQLNAESFLVAPDQKYVLLQSDSNVEGSRHHVYEVQTANTFPLGPTENIAEAPRLQHVVWAPINPPPPPPPPPPPAATAATPATSTMSPLPNGSIILNSLAGAAAGGAGKPTPTTNANGSANGSGPSNGNGGTKAPYSLNQAIAFVHHNDIYYKPKVQGELVCRITQTGAAGVFYNGVPDWTYENVPELESLRSSISFSPDGLFLAFLSFNDSEVNEYKYTWMGDNIKYPAVLSQRYPKAGSRNPNVTVNVVNLSVIKYIFPTQIKLPVELGNDSYVGGLTWASPIDLSVTVTSRDQTKATTVICRAPHFHCQVVHTEVTINDGWVLPAERPIFSARLAAQLRGSQLRQLQLQEMAAGEAAFSGNESQASVTNGQTTYEISNGGYLLKRLPVRDGEHGHYRHVVFISSLDRRPVPLTMGRFEVTEIVGWDERHEIVYFMAAPERRPGERHLYKISLKLNVTETNRTYITSTQPTCLTCDNTESTYRLHRARNINAAEWQRGERWEEIVARLEPDDCIYDIPKNCLYNRVQFSRDYSYYVQECLGPEAPSVYLVETSSNEKIFVLNAGDVLRHRLSQLAIPQTRTFSVEIRHGFHAQVRLYLPPGMREEEEVAFPLVLHVDASPGSQLVTERFHVDWNWYLCSQRSFIVAQIDGRGSGYQGELLRTQVHGKLGTVEIEDQLGVLTYLRDNLKFIDPLRICAFGWGYGGYASAMMLIDDSQQVLQCAVAINPIVSFGYHYSFFTERYIPLKGDYLRALQEADLTMKAGNIKGRNLMLMHGTADTLVHQEHTLMLVRALVDQQVKFRHQVYPDEDHAIARSLSHVYKTMEWYFDECFGPVDDNEWDPTGLFVFKQ
ncbi:inactive dipeptidyl peptidase 10 isoform X3 [Drosophila virilis]|nr:inactive dipeptidyl peptidase 10 isoform X1 [Drosophila virilis]